MTLKGQKMDDYHKELLSKSMLKFWANMSPEEKAERIEKFAGARRKPELADLPPQLEQPKTYFRGYQQKFREKYPSYYRYFKRYRDAKKLGYNGTFKEYCEQNNLDIKEPFIKKENR